MSNFCAGRLSVSGSCIGSGGGSSGGGTVPEGGTGVSFLTPNRFLVGNGTAPVLTTKLVPVGDVIGTTDSQTLTNKIATDSSNDITARSLFTTNGANAISTYTAATPLAGQVLTATSGTVATWQTFAAAGVYGSEYESIESLTPINTTLPISISGGNLTGGFTKINFTTAVKPIGTYKIDWSFNWTISASDRDLCVAITLDGSSVSDIKAQIRTGVISNTGGLDTDDFTIPNSGNDQRQSSSGFFETAFGSATTHTINMTFGRGSNGVSPDPVTLSDARIQIIRVI